MRVLGAHNSIHRPMAVISRPRSMLMIRKAVAHFGWKMFNGFRAPKKNKKAGTFSFVQLATSCLQLSPLRSFEITSILLCRKLLLVGVCRPMILFPLRFCGTVVAR